MLATMTLDEIAKAAANAARRTAILRAIDDAGGNRSRAANALGISKRSLIRWCHDLDLWAEVDAIANKHGYLHSGGTQRGG